MLDYSLFQYEWQKNADLVMCNVNLEKIVFSDDCSISFHFLNSYDGEFYKKITCNNVWKFTQENGFGKEERFPLFICEVRIFNINKTDIAEAFDIIGYGFSIPGSDTHYLLCMDSGDVSIKLICGSVIVR